MSVPQLLGGNAGGGRAPRGSWLGVMTEAPYVLVEIISVDAGRATRCWYFSVVLL